MSERSMTLNLTNRASGPTFEFGNAASDGSVSQTRPGAIAASRSMSVSALNRSGGCTGQFSLSGGGVNFGVSYDHPSGPGSTTVSVEPSTRYLAGVKPT
jgi:hypothetical protein